MTETSDTFAALLTGFLAKRTTGLDPTLSHVDAIRNLLRDFEPRRRNATRAEEQESHGRHGRFVTLIEGHAAALERYRKDQENVADNFNLLGVLQLTKNEIRHSMVLAWLLDHDLRKLGTHAQGNLGFKLFLREAGLPGEYAECPYWVRREVRGDGSIVDVEVASRGQFIIHIESKIGALEGPDQTEREWDDLQLRAKELAVSDNDRHALFLTPQGASPMCNKFKPLSWNKVARVLDAFASAAKPDDVRLFARHYVRTLWRFIVTQVDE